MYVTTAIICTSSIYICAQAHGYGYISTCDQHLQLLCHVVDALLICVADVHVSLVGCVAYLCLSLCVAHNLLTAIPVDIFNMQKILNPTISAIDFSFNPLMTGSLTVTDPFPSFKALKLHGCP